jgi:hypothetical protein
MPGTCSSSVVGVLHDATEALLKENTDWGRTGVILKRPVVIEQDKWGMDHYRLLKRLEERAVDHQGSLEFFSFRVRHEHRDWAKSCDTECFPIALKDGSLYHNHDDLDIIEDFEAAGLITLLMGKEASRVRSVASLKPRVSITVQFTDEGWEIIHALRQHMGHGGYYDDFEHPAF